MHLTRRVEPEQLDSLAPDEPEAIRSRRDLQRLNRLMLQARSIGRLVREHGAGRPLRRVVDLGGGDGTLLLHVARELASRTRDVHAVVVDRWSLVSDRTRAAFERSGWTLEVAEADVLTWMDRAGPPEGVLMLANLFLHHLEDSALRRLFAGIAAHSDRFVAVEPRRSAFVLTASRLVGWVGASAVTRSDAVTSVRAGFTGRELSALWPTGGDWFTREGPAGPFSHGFVASRRTR